jgi:hypothetical protein
MQTMAFEMLDPLGDWNQYCFRGWLNAAHLLARLRIAVLVFEGVARLATEWPGSSLLGRDLNPLDDEPNFRSYR